MAGESSGATEQPPRQILVIDDDEQLREMLRRMLEYAGYDVVEACDGEEAMKLLRNREVDLVITDILMPNREGLEPIMELRRGRPQLPIIAISGGGGWSGSSSYLVTATKLGAAKTLAKPFTRQEILDAVAEVFAEAGAA